MGRDALREGACVKERGAAAAAARRCTRHALESCGLARGGRLIANKNAVQLAPCSISQVVQLARCSFAGARQRTNTAPREPKRDDYALIVP